VPVLILRRMDVALRYEAVADDRALLRTQVTGVHPSRLHNDSAGVEFMADEPSACSGTRSDGKCRACDSLLRKRVERQRRTRNRRKQNGPGDPRSRPLLNANHARKPIWLARTVAIGSATTSQEEIMALGTRQSCVLGCRRLLTWMDDWSKQQEANRDGHRSAPSPRDDRECDPLGTFSEPVRGLISERYGRCNARAFTQVRCGDLSDGGPGGQQRRDSNRSEQM
jgi:hypothetical protein